jgi:hypothetical protein
MPIHRELDKIDRWLRTHLSGCVTRQDIREHINLLRRSGGHQYPELIDAREVEPACISRQDLMAVAHEAAAWLGPHAPARRAIVVASDQNFGTARTFASLVAGWLRLGVFEDLDEAEAWLRTPIAGAAVLTSQRPAAPPA